MSPTPDPMSESPSKSRSWLWGALFVWSLTAAVALAAFSGKDAPPPRLPSQLTPLPPTPTPPPTPAVIAWEKDFESAMQRARREQKPVMIDVYTTWCSPCKYLDSEIYTQQNVRAQSVYWISVKVDAEARPDIAQSYGVRGFPTLIFASPDGRPLSVEDGVALDPSFSTTVVQWMQDARAKFVPSSN